MSEAKITKSYSTVMIECDKQVKLCEVKLFALSQPSVYKIIQTPNEPNVLTVRSVGEVDVQHYNAQRLHHLAKIACNRCGKNPKELIAQKTK